MEDSAVGSAVRSAVRSAVGSAVRSAVDSAVRSADKLFWHYWLGGQFWSGWNSWATYFTDICSLDLGGDMNAWISAYADLSRSGSYLWPNADFCMVCDRPLAIHGDDRGRLHCDSEMAIYWPDGWGLWMIHGVRVNEQIVMRPEMLDASRIDSEKNVEVRRVMIDRFGVDRYMQETKTVVVAEISGDCDFVGLRGARLVRRALQDDEPIVMVDCVDSTPQPDGIAKRYMLRVDPNAYNGEASKDVLAALASTWRNADGSLLFKRPQDYRPEVET